MQEYHVDNTSFEPCAFAVVQVALFLTPELAFVHELGTLWVHSMMVRASVPFPAAVTATLT